MSIFTLLVFFTLYAFCLSLIVAHSSGAQTQTNTTVTQTPQLLLVSFDGFKASYLTEYASSLPNILTFSQQGIQTSLKPVFPSKTFPNHYSIVTGLYSESHGILGRRVFNPITNTSFDGAGPTDPIWWGGEPIWVTCEKSNVKAASMFWVGSNIKIKNYLPSYYVAYNPAIDFTSRIHKVLDWFDLPELERPQFVTIYFDEPDGTGHSKGPNDTIAISNQLKIVDDSFGLLLNGLKSKSNLNNLNILVVGDHGMTQLDEKKVIYLDEILGIDFKLKYNLILIDEVASIEIHVLKQQNENYSYESVIDEIYFKLNNYSENINSNLNVKKKKDIPERFHFKNNEKVGDIIVYGNIGWAVLENKGQFLGKGTHGWDNNESDMFSILIGVGPDFQVKGKMLDGNGDSEVVENIHIYELMSHLLKIEPASNNGSFGAVKHFLKD